MWHVACNVKCDMKHGDIYDFWIFGEKGWLTHLNICKDFYRTAPATPGLLNKHHLKALPPDNFAYEGMRKSDVNSW